ncbi:MAG: DUF262 domain-containing protein [Syntrophomonas sp.]
MSIQAPITISQALDGIRMRKYFLPSIQRGVVWGHEQIEKLFDSLMRDYPIGSLLFWRVGRHNVNDYIFYEFLDHYHERDTIDNNPVHGPLTDEILGVLDGQQRLTALHIGLGGWYAYKTPWKRWDNNAAFPKRQLYLNLLSPQGREDLEYDFRFLTDDEAKNSSPEAFWYKVSDILPEKSIKYVVNYLIANKLNSTTQTSNRGKTPDEILSTLFEIVHVRQLINYYLEDSQDLNKVLNIFIRVNSGGTQLSYSDLLLSIASASWKVKNAREEIYDLVKDINCIGAKFNFDKDFILKACLVLCDFRNIEFNVNNFNHNNMLMIENEWDNISEAIRTAVVLIDSLGFNRDTLTANNAVIPIAYYILKRRLNDRYITNVNEQKDRDLIRKWLSISLLKRIFGSHADNVLTLMRDEINKSVSKGIYSFPFDQIKNSLKGNPTKSFIFTNDDIENLFTYNYGQAYTFQALALLYPWLDYRNQFHLDHMHPKSKFTKKEFSKLNLTNDDAECYLKYCNNIVNLQLIEGPINQQKSDMSLSDWINCMCSSSQVKDAYFNKHYIDISNSLNFDDFIDFSTKRKLLMKAEFERLLQ